MDWTRGRTIGSGSTATVSVAKSNQSGHVFAVKSSELSKSEPLRREQRILSTLSCPQVVAYKGCDITSENGKLLYNLFLEYAPSGTITDAIQKQGGRGLDEAMVRSYTRGVLLGLEFLHSSGIVHCDIKGQNIFITDGGVKIADLGCARRVDHAVSGSAAWSVAGTPVYMAPEVARGEQQGFPADVWALGCTIIEMATGRAPWPDVADPVSALYRIGFSCDVPEIPSNISKEAKDFLSKCLKRDPVERWSVNELLSHEFMKGSKCAVKETDSSELGSPNSVLHRQLWDSMEETESIQEGSSRQGSWSMSIMKRMRQLGEDNLALSSSKMPDWEWDENWLTVRSNSNLEGEEDDSLLHVDEPTTTSRCGGDPRRVSEDNDFLILILIDYYPAKISGQNIVNTMDYSGDIRHLYGNTRMHKLKGDTNPNAVHFIDDYIRKGQSLRTCIMLMGEIECKPASQVITDASITGQEKSRSLFSFDNVTKTSTSSILTRLHAGYFRISLSFGGQALLWKILTEPNCVSQGVWHVSPKLPSRVCFLLWYLAILTQISLSFVYILRCFFHLDLVRAEFLHHIGVNYLYAPWVSWLILLQSAPMIFPNSLFYLILCWIFTIPLAMLDIKIYGQWFTTEKRFLSIMANPTSQVSVIGNLVAARAAAQMGWKESAICMWSLGMVHYLVLFVTLYQRLSDGSCFPLILRPTFFLFFAAPSMASLAWNSITGSFDTTSKMLFFLSLFLFMSLACRPSLFKKSMRKFNVTWWAYSFPLTFLALAAAEYAQEVKGHVPAALMLVLSILSILVFVGLMLLTAANAEGLLGETDPIVSFSNNPRTST